MIGPACCQRQDWLFGERWWRGSAMACGQEIQQLRYGGHAVLPPVRPVRQPRRAVMCVEIEQRQSRFRQPLSQFSAAARIEPKVVLATPEVPRKRCALPMDAGRATAANVSITQGDHPPRMRCDFLEGHRPERLDRHAGEGSQDGALPSPEPPFESRRIPEAQATVLQEYVGRHGVELRQPVEPGRQSLVARRPWHNRQLRR
ncbi:hypothetical protein C8J35_1331 [Rhizobium sp. PP-F2F-G38]|nr:hypothetical protein C8J35_1331 [Rhizobium sp. PP-F2F-G38]